MEELKNHLFCCPYCGWEYTIRDTNGEILKSIGKNFLCPTCGESAVPIVSKHPFNYYFDKQWELYNWKTDILAPHYYHDIFLKEEIFETPLFDMEKYKVWSKEALKGREETIRRERERNIAEANRMAREKREAIEEAELRRELWEYRNAPRCPTCGSTNVEKISPMSQLMGAFFGGILNKTATSQFECHHCGYKW